MHATRPLIVHAVCDDEAQVWVATSEDVPGLATEADDVNALVEKLKRMISELLETNGVPHAADVPFEVVGQRFAVAQREAA